MPEETKTSDSLEGGIDSGIGAASAFAGAASAKAAASAGGAAVREPQPAQQQAAPPGRCWGPLPDLPPIWQSNQQ